MSCWYNFIPTIGDLESLAHKEMTEESDSFSFFCTVSILDKAMESEDFFEIPEKSIEEIIDFIRENLEEDGKVWVRFEHRTHHN